MTTLLDVAKKANVSKMTVSRVINHPDKVTDELKKLVYEAMRELDYHPNVKLLIILDLLMELHL